MVKNKWHDMRPFYCLVGCYWYQLFC